MSQFFFWYPCGLSQSSSDCTIRPCNGSWNQISEQRVFKKTENCWLIPKLNFVSWNLFQVWILEQWEIQEEIVGLQKIDASHLCYSGPINFYTTLFRKWKYQIKEPKRRILFIHLTKAYVDLWMIIVGLSLRSPVWHIEKIQGSFLSCKHFKPGTIGFWYVRQSDEAIRNEWVWKQGQEYWFWLTSCCDLVQSDLR